MKFVDYYQLLDVVPAATTPEIRRAYVRLAKNLHPDVGGDARKMQQLNSAYHTLRDDTKRRVYDLMHQTETGTASLLYRETGGKQSTSLVRDMSDDEIDTYINDVFREFVATKPPKTHTPFATLKKDLKRTLSRKPPPPDAA
jgi:DnaJ-class molecular chaperone